MAQRLDVVAQYAMDIFYTNYREDSGFFTIDDFIFHCAKEAADYLRQEFQQKYQELRQDKEDEVIDFSDDWLSNDVLKVERDGGALFATLKNEIFSLPFDSQNSGIQDLYITKPIGSCVQLERTTSGAAWRLRYLPVVNDRMFWYLQNANQIIFYNPGNNNIQEVNIEYVPTMGKMSLIPDAITDFVITNAIMKMNQLMQGKVVKKTLDNNQNKIIQSEINKEAVA